MKARQARLAARLRYRTHTHIGKYPFLIFPLYRLVGVYQNQIVNSSTELVIEGFPRSASTFCYYALQCAQGRPVKIATHLHMPAHPIRACRLKIPTLVLIRHPRDAVSSAMVREPYMSLNVFLERYLVFYKSLEPYKNKVVLADFKEVTSDFSTVIERINDKFNKNYDLLEYTEENLYQIQYAISLRDREIGGMVSKSYSPNPIKELSKSQIDFTKCEKKLKECEEIYERYLQQIVLARGN